MTITRITVRTIVDQLCRFQLQEHNIVTWISKVKIIKIKYFIISYRYFSCTPVYNFKMVELNKKYY